MTVAHLGGRGAGRRRSYSATAAPAWSAGVVAMVIDGRHHVDLWRTLFWHVLVTYMRRKNRDGFVLMDQTERF